MLLTYFIYYTTLFFGVREIQSDYYLLVLIMTVLPSRINVFYIQILFTCPGVYCMGSNTSLVFVYESNVYLTGEYVTHIGIKVVC